MQVYRRIEITVPLTKDTLDKINKFIIELRNKFKGVTWSSFTSSSSAHEGWGLNIRRRYEHDMVTIIFTDINPEAVWVERFAKELKKRMEKRFEPQQIWMTISDVMAVG